MTISYNIQDLRAKSTNMNTIVFLFLLSSIWGHRYSGMIYAAPPPSANFLLQFPRELIAFRAQNNRPYPSQRSKSLTEINFSHCNLLSSGLYLVRHIAPLELRQSNRVGPAACSNNATCCVVLVIKLLRWDRGPEDASLLVLVLK